MIIAHVSVAAQISLTETARSRKKDKVSNRKMTAGLNSVPPEI